MVQGTTLITGATGLVGNNVLRQLIECGHSVRVLGREESDPRALEGLDVETVRGDVTDGSSIGQACEGVSAVVHAAGYVQLGRRQLDVHRAINVDGTRHVAEAARTQGIRMVHVSTCDTIRAARAGPPANEDAPHRNGLDVPYVISKREAELEIRRQVDRGLDAVIVNPGFMLGPWDWKPSSGKMLLEVARGRGTFAPRGCFSVCDVRDVAAAIIAALDPTITSRQYLLTGETMRYLDAWKMFAQVTGGRAPLCRAGPLMLKVAGWGGDVWGRITGTEPACNSGALALAARAKNYSCALAQQELGYRVRPFRESVEDAWQWFVAHGYAKR